MDIKIRELKVRDRRKVTGIFKKAIEELRDESLKNIISSDVSQPQEKEASEQIGEAIVNIGVSVVTKALDILDRDVSEWFADLLNVTPEEYEDLPIDTDVKVIEQIRNAPEAEAFFTQCLALAKMTHVFAEPLRLLRERFASILQEEVESTEG